MADIHTRAEDAARASAKRTADLFGAEHLMVTPSAPTDGSIGVSYRRKVEYDDVAQLPRALEQKIQAASGRSKRPKIRMEANADGQAGSSNALVKKERSAGNGPFGGASESKSLIARPSATEQQPPDWHAPWKLMRVISGHLGWVRSLAVEPDNQWFASGAADRTIKIWNLATGALRLTLTGHISAVRGLAVSPRHPYLFSCGEDKQVKCWDLETNKVIRHYHGHLSGVYTLALHPHLDLLVTGGRDGAVRVWDMRSRANIHTLTGHRGTIADVKCQEVDPQIISGSLDKEVRLWDLAAGKSMGTLTHHKKGVRSLAVHPREFTFASASTGSIKQWKCPEGAFMQNFEGQNSVINTLSVNEDNVMFSGGDDGSMSFWDWKTGYRFQSMESTAQPGSLEAEAGIMTSTFDRTGLRLITGEADKTIKIWKQDENATEESHPVQFKPTLHRERF